MRDYIVTFDTYLNHIMDSWCIGVTANNAKEAKEIAKSRWESKSHQFHLEAHRGTAEQRFRIVRSHSYPFI